MVEVDINRKQRKFLKLCIGVLLKKENIYWSSIIPKAVHFDAHFSHFDPTACLTGFLIFFNKGAYDPHLENSRVNLESPLFYGKLLHNIVKFKYIKPCIWQMTSVAEL